MFSLIQTLIYKISIHRALLKQGTTNSLLGQVKRNKDLIAIILLRTKYCRTLLMNLSHLHSQTLLLLTGDYLQEEVPLVQLKIKELALQTGHLQLQEPWKALIKSLHNYLLCLSQSNNLWTAVQTIMEIMAVNLEEQLTTLINI